MRRAAWCGLLVCAGVVGQTPAEADRDRMLKKIAEARRTAIEGGAVGRVSSTLLLPAEPAAARAQGMNLLLRPPDARQALTTFADGITLLDDEVGAGDPRIAAMRAAMRRGRNQSPALEHLQGLKTVADLREAVVRGDSQVRTALLPLCAAVSPGDPSTVAALLRCLDDKDPEVRWRAALGISWSAGTAPAHEAVPALVERLADTDETVRAFAAGALGKIAPFSKDKELKAVVAALEKSRDPVVQQIGSTIRRDMAQRETAGLRGNGGRPSAAPPRGATGRSAPTAPAASRPTTGRRVRA